MDLIIALAQSKRFWMFVSGVIVVLGHLVGLALDPQRVFAFCVLVAGLMTADTVRPIVRKDKDRPGLHIFKGPGVAVLLLGLGLAMCSGCDCWPSKKPTPAPQPLTVVEQVTQSQLKLVSNGYAEAFGKVAAEIRTGSIKKNEDMRSRLVELTRSMRLAAEVPVLDEMNAHLPQDESGDWSDPAAVATYLQSLSDGYARVSKKIE